MALPGVSVHAQRLTNLCVCVCGGGGGGGGGEEGGRVQARY